VTVLHALEIAALEAASVWPYLHSLSVMLVTRKLPGVLGAIDIHGNAVAVLHVIEKVALVPISCSMVKLPHALSFVLHPLPGV